MDIDKWIERHEFTARDLNDGVAAEVVETKDLRELLTTHVIVPREPTGEMLRAAQSAWLDDPMKRTSTMYSAMLSTTHQGDADGQE